FDPASARANAERLSNERFKQQLSQFVAEKWQVKKKKKIGAYEDFAYTLFLHFRQSPDGRSLRVW
ncbi:MAG: hypothetical protein KDI79_21745, partial [Anaerolineae bacterium]|nr:hypothetical protein [Anaerolineae bacterium]